MKLKTLLALLIAAGLALLIVHQVRLSLRASRPADMPATARFVPTGYDTPTNEPLGQWIACRPSPDRLTDWCRVTDQRGAVVFEGQFLPIDSPTPVPADSLTLGRLDKSRLWTPGPSEQAPVPVIPLADGQLLVPAADRLALITRWSRDPDESAKYLAPKP